MGASRKKSYEIYDATKKGLKSINVDGKKYRFGKQGAMVIHDPGVAKEIDKTIGTDGGTGEVAVAEVDNARGRTPRRVWTFPRIPWKE